MAGGSGGALGGSITDKLKISKVIEEPVVEFAGVRRPSDFQDDPTCFGIPGSGLHRRHCDTDFKVTIAVTSTLDVFMSIHDGHCFQKVFGRNYICRMYVCYHDFHIKLPLGATSWDSAKFIDSSGADCDASEIPVLCEGRVSKTYDVSNPFNWVFGAEGSGSWVTEPWLDVQEGQEYYQSDLELSRQWKISQYGGESISDSKYVWIGNMSDENWRKYMGDSENGTIWLAGGIMYPTAPITSDIDIPARPFEVKGLNMASYYFPGDIQEEVRMSLNRPNGYLLIRDPGRYAEYLDRYDEDAEGNLVVSENGPWRAVKNTENDRAVETGAFENWGFRLVGDEWQRLIITGKDGGTDDTGEDGLLNSGGTGGIGSADGSGMCGCCMLNQSSS